MVEHTCNLSQPSGGWAGDSVTQTNPHYKVRWTLCPTEIFVHNKNTRLVIKTQVDFFSALVTEPRTLHVLREYFTTQLYPQSQKDHVSRKRCPIQSHSLHEKR